MKPTTARAVHLVVAVVAAVAVVWQLALIVNGEAVLNESSRPDLAVRLARFVSYFTILSNLLVLGCSVVLAAGPAPRRPGGGWCGWPPWSASR